MRSGCDASGYALMLLAIDEAGVQGAAPLFVAQGIGRGASLRERVVRLATPRARANDAAFLRTFVLAVLLAFIGGTGVALTTIRLAPSRSVTHGLLESSHWLRRGYALGIMSGAGMLRPSNAERLALFNVAKRSDPHPVNRAIASYALSHNIRATRMSRPALVR